MTDFRRLLRKKDLVDHFRLPRSTISDWINEFQVYIPTVKDGGSLYYQSETIDILTVIKELRDLNQPKPEIMRILAERGFPITIEEAVEDVQRIVNRADHRDSLLTVMQTMGQAIVKITEQDETLKRHDGQLTEIATAQESLVHKQSESDGRITELERTLADMAKQLEAAQKEIAAVNEATEAERNKGFFKRLFRG